MGKNGKDWKSWGDHPLVVAISVLAAILSIIGVLHGFLTSKPVVEDHNLTEVDLSEKESADVASSSERSSQLAEEENNEDSTSTANSSSSPRTKPIPSVSNNSTVPAEDTVSPDSGSDSQPENSAEDALDENYRDLSVFLENRQWEYADIETRRILLEIGKESIENIETFDEFISRANYINQGEGNILKKQVESDFLSYVTILVIPCSVFSTIDSLWNSASDGRFGFRVQKEIYVETTEGDINRKQDHLREIFSFRRSTWPVFAENVGWTGPSFMDGANVVSPNYTLDSSTPYGHLPSYVVLFENPQLGFTGASLGMQYMMFRLNKCGI